ncbi:hypothetical protein DCO58_11655 [Helicobacter saguini]|uniref:Uncharacterized protein n=1 Tax=Helicobacter saguini TaxID=1548018 RepID=A0A347VQ68_9HELI|nr:hypothetical protein [Helicobacter saguini]MWV61055.1 hypothetical protein [Helicobacter saguini]MWV68276.1 hypothetical protein [Helicobacter saguini]MWV70259.1 hypothetical protein [Helicobacter saguini]MWV72162.1 hypothetical protein [Helicobacter saguini]TLD95223.1 hypothetical protein LS64_002330 [Helicobacter saguini]
MISISKMILIPVGVAAASIAVYVPISLALSEYKPSKVTTIIESGGDFSDTKKIIEQVQTQNELNKIKDSTKEEFIKDTLNKNIDNVVSHADFEFENKKKKGKIAANRALKENITNEEPQLKSNTKSNLDSNKVKKSTTEYRSINTHEIKF